MFSHAGTLCFCHCQLRWVSCDWTVGKLCQVHFEPIYSAFAPSGGETPRLYESIVRSFLLDRRQSNTMEHEDLCPWRKWPSKMILLYKWQCTAFCVYQSGTHLFQPSGEVNIQWVAWEKQARPKNHQIRWRHPPFQLTLNSQNDKTLTVFNQML